VGKLPLDVLAQSIDLLSLSAHKLNGPQGVGALFLRKGVELEPLVHGGGQERGLRSGTENVSGLVGLGRAAELARVTLAEENARLVLLAERILTDLASRLPHAYLIGDRYRRLPGHLCLGFQGQEGEAIRLLLTLDDLGIAVSTGSACSAQHAGEPSSVLVAMGFDPVRARGSLRITLGRFNNDADVCRLLEVLPEAVESLRPITSHLAMT
jgi:cysteine desulfurase